MLMQVEKKKAFRKVVPTSSEKSVGSDLQSKNGREKQRK